MSRLIDADALMEALCRKEARVATIRYTEGFNDAIGRVRSMVSKAPTIDAVPVVRCGECKHMEITPDGLRWCNAWGGINGLGDDGFCNYGERRSEDD